MHWAQALKRCRKEEHERDIPQFSMPVDTVFAGIIFMDLLEGP